MPSVANDIDYDYRSGQSLEQAHGIGPWAV